MRHPSVQHLVDLLKPNSNLQGTLLKVAQRFETVRDDILGDIKEDNPEVAAGMRKLLEAKDCFVRAAGLIEGQIGQVAHDVMNDPEPAPAPDSTEGNV